MDEDDVRESEHLTPAEKRSCRSRGRPRGPSWWTVGIFAAFSALAMFGVWFVAGCGGPSQAVKQTGVGNTTEQTEQLFRDIAPKLVEMTKSYGDVRDIVTNDPVTLVALFMAAVAVSYLGGKGALHALSMVLTALTTEKTLFGAAKRDPPP